jgi:hypothetical protein
LRQRIRIARRGRRDATGWVCGRSFRIVDFAYPARTDNGATVLQVILMVLEGTSPHLTLTLSAPKGGEGNEKPAMTGEV